MASVQRPIDEKIVAMKMDNSDLKQKAAETTTIFGKLTQALNKIPGVNIGRVGKDLSEIQRAANRTDLSPLANSVEKVGLGFSKLEIMATTALVNITNRAVNAGLALQRSLTTQQIGDGFREYETKIGSIGTMLANTEWAGTSLDEVKETLNELNDYADLTIYNFGQMTSSIGRFTAAGVRLQDSAISIKGLGNLAAISGSTSEQMNSAMYQMSQMLAAGKMNLMDWNSLVNAGMGGKKSQDGFLETARAMGKSIDMSEGFRLSLEQGWLTADVFIETMKRFGNDESMTEAATKVRTFTQMMDTLKEGIGSGWAESWELIFGDFEEATLFWSTMADIISKPFEKSTKARNDFLRGIIDSGAIQESVRGLVNVTKPIRQIFSSIGEGFRLAFPPMSVNTIANLIKSFAEFTKGLIFSESTLENITKVFYGVFAIFSSVWEIVKSLTQAVFGLLPSFKEIGAGAVAVLAGFSGLSISINESIKSGTIMTKIMDGLGKVLEYVGFGLDWLGEKFKMVAAFMGVASVTDELAGTNKEITTMKDILTPVVDFFKSLFATVVKGFDWVKEKLAGFGQSIKDALPEGKDILTGGFIAGLVGIVGMTMKMAWDLFEVFTGWGKIGMGISEILESTGEALNAFSWQVRAQALMTIAIAVGVLTVALFGLSRIKGKELGNALVGMVTALTAIVGAMWIMTKYDITGTGMKAALQMVAMGVAVGVMAGALKLLSLMNTGEILRGILGLTGIMVALSGAMVMMSKFGGAKIGASSMQILAIATAMHILISAIKRISEVNPEVLKKGTITIGIILAEIGVFLKLAGGSKFGLGSTLGMLAIGQAIVNITKAIKEINTIEPGQLKSGLVTIGIILGSIAAFALITAKSNLLTAGIGILLLSGALAALVIPISLLGNMNPEKLAIGLGAMAIALLSIGAASLLMKGMIAAGIGIGLIAASLMLLLIPITAFSAMSWENLAKGLTGLAGVLLILGGAALLLAPATTPLLLFGAGIGLMGIAMLAAGAGMALFSAGLLSLATMTAASITTIVATMGTLILGLSQLIPPAVKFMTELFMQIIGAITREVPNIVNLFGDMIVKIITKIGEFVPQVVEAAVKIITNFIDGLADGIPRIIESAANLIVTFVDALAMAVEIKGPEFLDAIFRLMTEMLTVIVTAGEAVAQALFGWIPGVSKATENMGKKALEAIENAFDAERLGRDKGDELVKGIENRSNDVKNAGSAVAEVGKKGVESIDTTSSGNHFSQGFANGINSSSSRQKVEQASRNLANVASYSIADELQIQSPSKVTTLLGVDTGQGLAKGISLTGSDNKNSAESVFGAIMEGFGLKPEKKTTPVGKQAGEGFASGVASSAPKATKAAKTVTKAVKSEFDKLKEELSDRKYFDKLSLADEYDAWMKIANKYKKGTEERKEADRELYRLKKEIHQKIVDLNDEYVEKVKDANQKLIDSEKALNDEYERAVADRTKSLSSFVGLFDEVSQSSDVSGHKLLANLSGQVSTFIQWTDNLHNLSARGLDQNLIQELREMGPSAAAEIAALNMLTEAELDQYSSLWRQKNNLAREQAVRELEGLRKDTDSEIQQLRKETAAELELYKKEWTAKITEIRKGTANQFIDLNTSLTLIGSDAIKGLMAGMKNMEGPLKKEAERLASTVSSTIKKALKIKSPSRVTMADGEHVGEGLAIGLANSAKMVIDKAKQLAMTARDSLNEFLQGFELPQEDSELHFRAVIDYDSLDTSRFGSLSPLMFKPNLDLTNSLIAATKTQMRQNGNNLPKHDDPDNDSNDNNNTKPKQPLIVQSILNGRVIAEETYDDIGQLLASQTNVDIVMGGG